VTTIESAATTIRAPGFEVEVDEAQLAAVSFLARYSGRTLEVYRHDLRGFFQWSSDHGVVIMEASRAHIELFRAWMEAAGSRRRRSTVGSRLCAARTRPRRSVPSLWLATSTCSERITLPGLACRSWRGLSRSVRVLPACRCRVRRSRSVRQPRARSRRRRTFRRFGEAWSTSG
jgi:hypothetical protein